MKRGLKEIQEDIRSLTRIASFAIHNKLDELANEVEDVYKQGKDDKEKEILDLINQMKYEEFITIANTGNKYLNNKYKIEADILDRLITYINKNK